MKITMLCEGANLGKGIAYSPGDQFNWRKKNAQPHLDSGAAVKGHIDITPEAAQLCRDEEVNPRGIDGTGEGGRVLKSDVEAVLTVDEEPDEQAEPEVSEPVEEDDQPDETTFGDEEEVED